jgi:hypothetical protein
MIGNQCGRHSIGLGLGDGSIINEGLEDLGEANGPIGTIGRRRSRGISGLGGGGLGARDGRHGQNETAEATSGKAGGDSDCSELLVHGFLLG